VLLGFTDSLKFRVVMLEIAPNLYAVKDNYNSIDKMLFSLGFKKVFSPIREKLDDVIYVNQKI
jgi:hypothetical protein